MGAHPRRLVIFLVVCTQSCSGPERFDVVSLPLGTDVVTRVRTFHPKSKAPRKPPTISGSATILQDSDVSRIDSVDQSDSPLVPFTKSVMQEQLRLPKNANAP